MGADSILFAVLHVIEVIGPADLEFLATTTVRLIPSVRKPHRRGGRTRRDVLEWEEYLPLELETHPV
jgi:hypothetical protein